MDYPVLVNPGKPSKAASTRMRMKKKKSANASGAAKRRKTGAAARKSAPRRTQQAAAARPAAPNDSRPTIRRLRSELAQALARIEELKASPDTDFLLDILTLRRFEAERSRSVSFLL